MNDLLRACQNLIIFGEGLNVFHFAHLSVDEYLETQLPVVDSHDTIAKVCLEGRLQGNSAAALKLRSQCLSRRPLWVEATSHSLVGRARGDCLTAR